MGDPTAGAEKEPAAEGTIDNVPVGETIETAPTEWIPTDKTPDDPENPNRALLMGANSANPRLVANALNSGNKDAIDYALTNLLEPDSEGLATEHNGAARMFDSSYAATFCSPTFYEMLTPSARGSLVGAMQRMNIGGPEGVKALLAEMGASLADASVTQEPAAKPAVVNETANSGAVVGAPVSTAVPFAVDQSHAIDSMPVGTIATKISDTAVTIDHPDKGKADHGIGADDVLEHLPVGSTVAVVKTTVAGVDGKSVMVSLPANSFREEIGLIATSVHEAVARLWHWVKDETLAVEAFAKKVL